MRVLVIFLLVFQAYALVPKISYQNFKVYLISPSNQKQLQVISNLEHNENVKFWSMFYKSLQPVSVMVYPTFEQEFERILREHKINFEIIIEDAERIINEERVAQKNAPHMRKGEVSFDKYLRYSEIQDYLNQLAIDYSDLVSVENYGTSYENRNLTLIRISSGGNNQKPLIFVDAGIHAREWVAPAQALYIINQLVENPNNKHLIQNVDWLVIPLLNPDGYEYTHLVDRFWRKTRSKGKQCDGVDPNRNFDFHWMGPGSNNNECSNTYAGPAPFSEPETAALSRVIEQYSEHSRLYLTIHTAALCMLYPWGYTSDLPENVEELHALGTKAAEAIFAVNKTNYAVGTSWDVLSPASGSSRDWAYGVAGIKLSYTVELPPYGESKHDLPPELLSGVVQETFEGIKAFHEYVDEKFGKA